MYIFHLQLTYHFHCKTDSLNRSVSEHHIFQLIHLTPQSHHKSVSFSKPSFCSRALLNYAVGDFLQVKEVNLDLRTNDVHKQGTAYINKCLCDVPAQINDFQIPGLHASPTSSSLSLLSVCKQFILTYWVYALQFCFIFSRLLLHKSFNWQY